jgi:AcrR family transcriptional regulator
MSKRVDATPGAAPPTSLAERKNDLTRQLILDAAVDVLEHAGVSTLTMRAVAKRANISERTVFRYFATRDEFLDAVAEDARDRMALPAPPRTLEDLRRAPRLLYEALEARQKLVIAGLHSELFDRIRETAAKTRWSAVRRIVEDYAPKRPPRERKIASTNISYCLGATSWHFYRFYFRLSLEDAIACADTTIALSLDSLRV